MDLWALLSITAPGLFPLARAVLGVLPPTDRAQPRRPPAGPAAPPDPPGDAAPDQGEGGGRAAAQAGAGDRGRAGPPAHAHLPDPPAARAAEGARSDRRPGPQPVHHPAVADPAPPAQPGPVAARRAPRRRAGGQGRRAARPIWPRSWPRVTRRWCSASSPASWAGCASGWTEPDISYAYLDGQTRHRDQVVQQFRDGQASVFLISLKAGGFGLNLTEADYCFVLDPWWNPAAEAQAVDRTHRIGQTKHGDGLSAGGQGHHRGEGDGPQGPQGEAVRLRCSPRMPSVEPSSRPPKSASCWWSRAVSAL